MILENYGTIMLILLIVFVIISILLVDLIITEGSSQILFLYIIIMAIVLICSYLGTYNNTEYKKLLKHHNECNIKNKLEYKIKENE